MFSSFFSELMKKNMNFFSSFLDEPVDNNITSDEMTDDYSWANDLEMNWGTNNVRVVPVGELTEATIYELTEVITDEMPGFDDDKEFYPNNL